MHCYYCCFLKSQVIVKMEVGALSRSGSIVRGYGSETKDAKIHLQRPRPLRRPLSKDGVKTTNLNNERRISVKRIEEDTTPNYLPPKTFSMKMNLDCITNKSQQKLIDHQQNSYDFLTLEKKTSSVCSDVSDDSTSTPTICSPVITDFNHFEKKHENVNKNSKTTERVPNVNMEGCDEDTNDLFHELLLSKCVIMNDEHDDRTKGVRGYKRSTSSSSSSGGVSSVKSHLHMDGKVTHPKSQHKQANDSLIYSVTAKNISVLGNPKVYGFIAMVTDTSIEKVKVNEKENIIFLEIRGKTKNKVQAMKLLAERCEN